MHSAAQTHGLEIIFATRIIFGGSLGHLPAIILGPLNPVAQALTRTNYGLAVLQGNFAIMPRALPPHAPAIRSATTITQKQLTLALIQGQLMRFAITQQ